MVIESLSFKVLLMLQVCSKLKVRLTSIRFPCRQNSCDIVGYKRYRVKRAARDNMIQQIRDCEEALRNLVWLFVEDIIIIINSSSCGCHSDLELSIFLISSRMESLAPMIFCI